MTNDGDPPAVRLARAVARTAELTAGRAPVGVGHDDADDVAGTIASDDARGFDPRPALRAFHEAGAPAVVIGQVAGILHGSTELTGDLDVLWSGAAQHADRLVAAFTALGAELADDDGAPLPCDASAFALRKVQFRTARASGDCCTPALPWGALGVSSFIGRARWADLGGYGVRYLALDDLIAMRDAVGRPKDLRRAAELRSLRAEGPRRSA